MTALAIELQTYFTVFAHTQRDLAANTISAYRDTWRMLIRHLAESTRTRAERIDFTDVDAEAVSAFSDYLETERGNTVSTRNSRLCAIRAVLSHAVVNHPEHAATITRVDPTLTSLSQLDRRRHIEPFITSLTTAVNSVTGDPITVADRIRRIHAVGNFLAEITEWGWDDAPPRRLIFRTDLPRPPRFLPDTYPWTRTANSPPHYRNRRIDSPPTHY